MTIRTALTLALLIPGMPLTAGESPVETGPDMCCTEDGIGLVASYEQIAGALAADDLSGAIDAAEDLGLWAECSGETSLDRAVADLERARKIEEARIAFREISVEVIRLARWTPGHYVMTCPVANVEWIQTSPEIANPYYGAAGLTCGSIKETVGAE